jgi:hypothetical protein
MCSAHLNMGTISGTTHIKMIFSFSPVIGKHLIGNALWNAEDSIMQLIQILHSFAINDVFYNPPEENTPGESNLELRGAGNGYPCSYINQETPCPERHEHDAEVRWCTIWLKNCSHRDMTQSNAYVRLKISWTHLIIQSPNFVEVRWRSVFRTISLGKRCTSYNALPTPRKRAADRLPQASGG